MKTAPNHRCECILADSILSLTGPPEAKIAIVIQYSPSILIFDDLYQFKP